MSRRIAWSSTAFVLLVSCKQADPSARTPAASVTGTATATATPPATASGLASAEAPPTPEQAAFRDAAIDPPEDYRGPRFKLSADYPQTQPAATAENSPWLKMKVDFGNGKSAPDFKRGGWADYMKVLLNYIKEGQDPNLKDEIGFQTTVNGKTRWYHMPWMAFDLQSGREYVHGCTNERTAFLSDLNGPTGAEMHSFASKSIDPKCKAENEAGFESWSVGFYNEIGGWAIGQAFPRRGADAGVAQTVTDQGRTAMKGLPFPEGTLVAKVLTTSATPDCVPVLKNAPAWTVDRHRRDAKLKYTCERERQTDYILQIDVAVVDARSPTRWVYGTFVYDGGLPGATFWERLQPLGVQWGSDPNTWPAVEPAKSKPIVQSSLNPDVKTYQHQGCNGRLAGPVDNPQSSCMSCHSDGFAVAPAGTPITQGFPPSGNIPPIFGFKDICPLPNTTKLTPEQLEQNKAYFSNYAYPASYPGYSNLISMDTSLQLQEAMQQYAIYRTNNSRPQACSMAE
ncbi:hypothetical protein [Sorangium sp. So ce341]|uniref:hypothetical protein n=1 Tax=Sorangium sp. So ce341 TaxID=3133302 RepID=UPI003F6282CB